MDIRASIRAFFAKAIRDLPGDEADIFDLGLVDSLFAVQLVAFVESEFDITLAREDLDIEHFSSMGALTRFVAAKLEKAGRATEASHGPNAH
jgi:acyl carrier protein